jgi:hypothetical protein
MIRNVVLSVLLLACTTVYSQKKTPIAVVELFTSEGCSSCPAADELLKQVAQKREHENKPIIALAFHITYWNHLGWIDPFSNELFTDRQKMYVSAFKQTRIYTPQAIVNGMHEFVGSNAIAFNDTLAKAEKRRALFEINASARQQGDSIQVEYSVDSESKNQVMNIALVEKSTERTVTRGENKNRTLRHYNVVRDFQTLDLKKRNVRLARVKEVVIDNMEVILYVQHKKTLRIGGAIKIPISE